MRVLLLIDGEHYPPAVRDAIETLEREGRSVVGALFCGGSEKVDLTADPRAADAAYGIEVVHGPDLGVALRDAIGRFGPDVVLDCTDEPVLSPADRFRLAAVALRAGVPFTGADFELRPPDFADILTRPAVAIFATGKRTGKTALSGAYARHLVAAGRRPVIISVGRGGPNPPRVIEAGTPLSTDVLLELAAAGQHASSDYVEDALTSGVATIGCVRVGGGLAGATVTSTMPAGARLAQEREEDLVILEGSGASVPEVRWHASMVVVPATIDPRDVGAFLNPYRLLLADQAVVTMADDPAATDAVCAAIHGSAPELEITPVVFRPQPLTDVDGRTVFLCTTAPRHAAETLVGHLEGEHGCRVVGVSHHLADRDALRRDLADAADHDTVLVELKAAAVDVAARSARDRGVDVVFVNNQVVGSGIAEAFDRVTSLAVDRAERR